MEVSHNDLYQKSSKDKQKLIDEITEKFKTDFFKKTDIHSLLKNEELQITNT